MTYQPSCPTAPHIPTFTQEFQTVFTQVAQIPGHEELVKKSKTELIAYDVGRVNPVLLGVPFAVYGIKTEQIIYAALGVAIGTLVQRITSRRAQELLKQGKETLANTTLEQRV